MKRAVVDVGSNSVLLTVMERENGGWKELDWTSEVTGLGVGTRESGLLSEEAMDRTLAAIARAFASAGDLGAPCVAAATMAVRIAKNADAFLDQAKAQGTPVIVLSGDDEARLGLQAVVGDPTFDFQRVSVIDPGGHSTELAIAEAGHTVFRRSFPVGALGVTAMRDESPDRAARLRAVVEIDAVIGEIAEPGGVAVALGATPTNLVSVRNALGTLAPPQPPPREQGWEVHGQRLEYEEVSRAVEWMCEMSLAERAALPGLEKGRERTIHVGALILERFLNALHLDYCLVSTRGWRHALAECDVYF
jgi:exopolyphosphatase/guanosine-5'-triphosphate,3'-diphosphate pyrophosphatase